MTLPDPMRGAVARMVKIPFSDKVAEKPNAPLNDDPHGTLALALRSGFAQHLEGHSTGRARSHPGPGRRLKTRAEALEYLKYVTVLVRDARARAGVGRSATVRDNRARMRPPR